MRKLYSLMAGVAVLTMLVPAASAAEMSSLDVVDNVCNLASSFGYCSTTVGGALADLNNPCCTALPDTEGCGPDDVGACDISTFQTVVGLLTEMAISF